MFQVKEDFVSLFEEIENELQSLSTRFNLKHFNYMFTSQRTINRIYKKLKKISEEEAEDEHHNFWSDLRRLGLAKPDSEELSELGESAYLYFHIEKDNFKREHFVLSKIRNREYNISEEVYEEYEGKVQNFYEYLQRVPDSEVGKKLLMDEEKLFFTECLNTFPEALEKYFELSYDRQHALDTLRESGLVDLFDLDEIDDFNEFPYAKVANRIKNRWRALNRRTNFVKSVILSKYEEMIIEEGKKELYIHEDYEKVLEEEILVDIIRKSEKIDIVYRDGKQWIQSIRDIDEIEKEERKRESGEENELQDKDIEEIESRLEELEEQEQKPTQYTQKVKKPSRDLELSALVKKRRNYTCEVCGREPFLGKEGNPFAVTHHIVPLGPEYGGLDVPSNMVVLCSLCHDKIHYGSEKAKKEVYETLKLKGIFEDFQTLYEKEIISESLFESIKDLDSYSEVFRDLSGEKLSEAIENKRPLVYPGSDNLRLGKGFSKKELEKVELSVERAKDMGIKHDEMRSSCHDINVKILEILKE